MPILLSVNIKWFNQPIQKHIPVLDVASELAVNFVKPMPVLLKVTFDCATCPFNISALLEVRTFPGNRKLHMVIILN